MSFSQTDSTQHTAREDQRERKQPVIRCRLGLLLGSIQPNSSTHTHTHTQQHTRNIQTIGGRDELDKQKIDVGESI